MDGLHGRALCPAQQSFCLLHGLGPTSMAAVRPKRGSVPVTRRATEVTLTRKRHDVVTAGDDVVQPTRTRHPGRRRSPPPPTVCRLVTFCGAPSQGCPEIRHHYADDRVQRPPAW